jgi:hypothetical protein
MLALGFLVSSHMKPYKSRAAWSCLVLRLTLAFFPALLNGLMSPTNCCRWLPAQNECVLMWFLFEGQSAGSDVSRLTGR